MARVVIVITTQDLEKAAKKRGGKRIPASERPARMASRFHGQAKNKTVRRKSKQSARVSGWED